MSLDSPDAPGLVPPASSNSVSRLSEGSLRARSELARGSSRKHGVPVMVRPHGVLRKTSPPGPCGRRTRLAILDRRVARSMPRWVTGGNARPRPLRHVGAFDERNGSLAASGRRGFGILARRPEDREPGLVGARLVALDRDGRGAGGASHRGGADDPERDRDRSRLRRQGQRDRPRRALARLRARAADSTPSGRPSARTSTVPLKPFLRSMLTDTDSGLPGVRTRRSLLVVSRKSGSGMNAVSRYTSARRRARAGRGPSAGRLLFLWRCEADLGVAVLDAAPSTPAPGHPPPSGSSRALSVMRSTGSRAFRASSTR